MIILGQERCGTHTMAAMLAASKVSSGHEIPPSLCKEAFLRVEGQPYDENLVNTKINSLSYEANHRLQFFADLIYQQHPDETFIFLFRNPVSMVRSLIATFAHWEGMNFPEWYYAFMKRRIPIDKYEFNTYRIRTDTKYPWPIAQIRSVNKGLNFSLPLLEKIQSNLTLLKTDDIGNKSRDLWMKNNLEWNSTVDICSKTKNDSIFIHINNDRVLDFATKQSEVYADDIKNEFRQAIHKFEIGKTILKELNL